jgi:hypothetical protein
VLKHLGALGCFTILNTPSYNMLLNIANDYGQQIYVKNEFDEVISFKEVVQWLNPNAPINGACKFIKPPIKKEVLTSALELKSDIEQKEIPASPSAPSASPAPSAHLLNFNNSDIDTSVYEKRMQEEINSAKYYS